VTEKEEEIDSFFSAFTREIEAKHQLRWWSIGGDMADVGGSFISHKRMTQEQGRLLLLKMVDCLLRRLNSQERLHPYMAKVPFPVDRLRLSICFRRKNSCIYTYKDGSIPIVIQKLGVSQS